MQIQREILLHNYGHALWYTITVPIPSISATIYAKDYILHTVHNDT